MTGTHTKIKSGQMHKHKMEVCGYGYQDMHIG